MSADFTLFHFNVLPCQGGFAIIFSGFIVPRLNDGFGANGWRVSWLLLGLIVFVVAVVAAGLIRNDPADKGLEPVGMVKSLDYDPSATKGSFSTSRILAHLGILYFLFGATYVIYGTFTPSYLASAGLTAIALFVSAFLPKPSPQD